MAEWYALKEQAKLKETDTYIRGDRVTSLATTTTKSGKTVQVIPAWSSPGILVTKQKLEVLIRSAAKAFADKVEINTYLKPKGYFVDTFVGKKPVGGLTTEDELAHLKAKWENNHAHVTNTFDGVKAALSNPLGVGGLPELVEKIKPPSDPISKAIQETVSRRIPNLLTTTGRGKDQQEKIVKGGTLYEKLTNLRGGNSVRTIGRVMWSPLNVGFTQAKFCDLVMTIAVSAYYKNKVFDVDTYIADAGAKLSAGDIMQLHGAKSGINTAIQLYLEVIPDNKDIPSWKTWLGL